MIGTPIPVTILTGFLGSGKTTLLRHALAQPAMADTAVLINEVGEIGLDHLLVDHIDEDTVLLASGCLCCAVRADLAGGLRRLLLRRQTGAAPPFRRVVIETSGLADPGPIISTLATTGLLRDRCTVGAVVTTVDALYGGGAIRDHAQALRQVALADRLVVTKTDLSADTDALRQELGMLNRDAERLEAVMGAVDARVLFAPRPAQALRPSDASEGGHTHAVASFDLRWSDALSWPRLIAALERLLGDHGPQVLRIKGLAHIAGRPRPLVIHAVQHTLFPPAVLDRATDIAGSFLTIVTHALPQRDVAPYFDDVAA